MRKFAPIEKVLITYFMDEDVLDTVTTTELPHDFENEGHAAHYLPVIVVDRISGANLPGNPYLDRPVVDVDAYAGNREEAAQLAEDIRWWLTEDLIGRTIEGMVFSRTRVVVGPRHLPHANPNVRRYTGSYELFCHPAP